SRIQASWQRSCGAGKLYWSSASGKPTRDVIFVRCQAGDRNAPLHPRTTSRSRSTVESTVRTARAKRPPKQRSEQDIPQPVPARTATFARSPAPRRRILACPRECGVERRHRPRHRSAHHGPACDAALPRQVHHPESAWEGMRTARGSFTSARRLRTTGRKATWWGGANPASIGVPSPAASGILYSTTRVSVAQTTGGATPEVVAPPSCALRNRTYNLMIKSHLLCQLS